LSEPTKNCGSIHYPPSTIHRPPIDHPTTTKNSKTPLFSKLIPKHQQPKIQSFSETLQKTVGTALRFTKKSELRMCPYQIPDLPDLHRSRNGYRV
jgi:hypothetical protein